MRKILSLVLALSMVLGMFSFAFAANLSDIEGEYYEAAVEALVELGVVNGYGDGTFKPNNEVTRAEMAKMLVIALGQKQAAEIAKGSTQFSDVAADHWAAGYINVAAQYKVIVGYPDGTFLPEEKVTYAEAVTMALRALGYKNVVESAGTWPTNYITKATELQLLDDMKYNGAEDGAKRGNIAILLWNMLRTEMWAIREENQTNGMTYGKTTDEPMLNIKFPDYEYEDEALFVGYTVDDTEVEVTVDVDGNPVTGELKSGDLLRLIPEMQVAYLYNKKTETFLTLTCVDTLVEGRVDKNGKLNDKEYNGIDDTNRDQYLVLLVEGKRVIEGVQLPDGGTEIGDQGKSLKAAQKEITEDTLAIIDGEWGNGKDLREGDVYTKIVASDLHANFAGTFYVVARDRVEGTFESITWEADEEKSRGFIEVDGDEYDALIEPKIYEYDEKKEEYNVVDFDKVYAKKDNKYLEEDVELACNYLGEVLNMYFGQIKGEDNNDIKYFVLTGNHPWFTSSEDGMVYYMKMTDTEGDEDKRELDSEVGANLMGIEMNGGLYKFLTDTYVNGAGGKDADGYLIDKEAGEAALRNELLNLVMFFNLNKDGQLEEADPAEYAKVYAESDVAKNPDELLDDDNYLDNGKKVTKSTKVIKITPVLDDDKVVDIEVEVLDGPEALKGVESGICVVEVDDDGNEKVRAAYVFVAEDAKSSELQFGVIEKVGQYKGAPSVTISGTRYELEAALPEDAVGTFVSFKVADDGIATIRDDVVAADLADATVILATDVDDELVTVDNYADPMIDTEAETVIDKFEKYQFVLVTGSFNDDDKAIFDADADVLGEGIEGVSFKKGDRLVEGAQEKVIFVIRLSDINIEKEMIDNTGVKVDKP